MRQQLIKRLEEVRPNLEEAKVLVDQLIKRLEEVRPVREKRRTWSSE